MRGSGEESPFYQSLKQMRTARDFLGFLCGKIYLRITELSAHERHLAA
jgi:hypothetical protein